MATERKYTIRRMEEADLDKIAEKANAEFGGGLAGLFSQNALKEAFETDPIENFVLEKGDEIAGFAFCGINHERDERHPISVGYMGRLSAPTVFRGHASRKTKKLLWKSAIDSLSSRKTDVIRWIVYGDPSPDISAREDVELAMEFGFVKKGIPKDEKIIDEKHRNGFYTIVKLPLSGYDDECMPSKNYKIRKMREEDMNEASKILDMSFDPLETHCAPSEIRAKMRNGWVCEYGNRIVGCAFSPVYENKDLVELQGQAVHPDYRDRGIATEMTKTILNYLKDEGVGVVVAGIRNNNIAEYKVLSSLGFALSAGETWMFCKDLRKGKLAKAGASFQT